MHFYSGATFKWEFHKEGSKLNYYKNFFFLSTRSPSKTRRNQDDQSTKVKYKYPQKVNALCKFSPDIKRPY